MNRLTETAPERIWLHTTGGAPEISASDADWFLSVGKSQCYVPADLLEKAQARVAELERIYKERTE